MTSEAHLSRVSLCFDSRCLLSTVKPPKSIAAIRNRLLASEASEDSFHSANEELFLLYDVRTDVRRFQHISL